MPPRTDGRIQWGPVFEVLDQCLTHSKLPAGSPFLPWTPGGQMFWNSDFFQNSEDNTFITYYVTAPEGSEAAPHSQTLIFLQRNAWIATWREKDKDYY